jgi:phospholipid/cholesterol/gamma-HCH transport system substrate-binding protein
VKRSGDIRWGEYRLGLLILVGMAIFLWASIRGGAAFFERRVPLSARFRDVGGLNEGSPVWFRGVEVGSVRTLTIRPTADSSYVEVVLSVKRETLGSLTEGSRARIAAINFFGEKFVDLVPGVPGAARVRPGQMLESEEAIEFAQIMTQSERGLTQLERLGAELQIVAARVRSGQGSLGLLVNDRALYDDLRRLSSSTARLADALNESQGRTARSLVAMASQLDSLAARMNRGEGTLGLLARDPALYRSLAGATAGADSVLGKVNAGEGSAGLAVNDRAAYQALTQSLQRLNALLADIQKNPKRYFKFSVF